jgi:hypothetical protein
MITRVEWWRGGWYICHYANIEDLLANSPEDAIGPYKTEAEAKRVLAETTDLDKDTVARKKAYDPRHDPAPASLKASLDAGIPTDYDDDDSETDPSEGVQLELQQTQELRDVPPKIQGD